MSENICYSGGARGADRLFGNLAERVGHKVCHLHFDPKNRNRPNFRILTETELQYARMYLVRANRVLERSVPPVDTDVYKLLARNYYQIRDSSRIYAVGWLADGKVQGGTAWAVQMFIDSTMDPEIYFFDQAGRGWLKYSDGNWTPCTPPHPHGRWTGIGSRELSSIGEAAINGLFA